jgi:hypothetical protein
MNLTHLYRHLLEERKLHMKEMTQKLLSDAQMEAFARC